MNVTMKVQVWRPFGKGRALPVVFAMRHGEVTADESGLRWRQGRHSDTISWKEVAEYRREGPYIEVLYKRTGPDDPSGKRVVLKPPFGATSWLGKRAQALENFEAVLRAQLDPTGWQSAPPGKKWEKWWWSPDERSRLASRLGSNSDQEVWAMRFGRGNRPAKNMPSEEQIDAFVAQKLAKADVVRRLRDEARQGKTDFLREVLSPFGPVTPEKLRSAQHQARWGVYWDLRDLQELQIVTDEEVSDAWKDCERYYGETEARQAREQVDQMIASGEDATLARGVVAAKQLPTSSS